MSRPQVGDFVRYYRHPKHDDITSGILAERGVSSITGNPRCRVVNFWSEASDPDAGRWVGIEDVLSIDPPSLDSPEHA